KKLAVFCLTYLIDTKKLEDHLLTALLDQQEAWTNEKILNKIPLGEGSVTHSFQEILNKMILGEVFIYIESEKAIVSYNIPKADERSLDKAEIESVILGPQIAFTESLATNMNVLRQSIQSTDLVFEKIMVGKRIPREACLVYLK